MIKFGKQNIPLWEIVETNPNQIASSLINHQQCREYLMSQSFHAQQNSRHPIFRTMVTCITISAVLCSLAACGTKIPESESTTNIGSEQITLIAKDDSIASLVPQKIKDKGTLVVATDATAPPNESIASDGKTIEGNEIDFLNQIGSILGLKIKLVNISFDSIIPGLQAGRYDLTISGMRDTKEREQQVDFVTYAKTGVQIFTKADNKDKYNTVSDLCGHSVAMQSGTVQVKSIEKQSQQCVADGQKAINIKSFKTQSDQIQAVSSGQADTGVQNYPNNVYLAKSTNNSMIGVGESFDEGLWGMALPKESGMAEPLQKATQKLIDSPQYKQILSKWNVEKQAIEKSVINGAES